MSRVDLPEIRLAMARSGSLSRSPERREASRKDRTPGPRWVRLRTVEHGRERSRAVTDGSEEPQVAGPPAHAAGMMRAGDSDCGPERHREAYVYVSSARVCRRSR
jgi:hypothetical protein